MNFYRGRLALRAAACLALLFSVMLLTMPQEAARGFADGVRLCLHSVLPALFPFFVVCNLLAADPTVACLGRPLRPLAHLWGLESERSVLDLLLSWLGGYVVCAQLAARGRKNNELTMSEAERLLMLGCCASPGFVIGCAGGLMLGSVRAGVLLYGMQLAANMLTAACMTIFVPKTIYRVTKSEVRAASTSNGSLPEAISAAVGSSLQICGCTIFFCIAAALIQPLLPENMLIGALVRSALEFSTGSAAFAAMGGCVALYGLALCISLPGLSVFCQISAILDGCVPLRRLLLSRLLHTVWFQLLVRLGARTLPGTFAAFSSLGTRVIPMNRLPPDAAAICFIFLLCTLYKLRQTFYNRKSSLH